MCARVSSERKTTHKGKRNEMRLIWSKVISSYWCSFTIDRLLFLLHTHSLCHPRLVMATERKRDREKSIGSIDRIVSSSSSPCSLTLTVLKLIIERWGRRRRRLPLRHNQIKKQIHLLECVWCVCWGERMRIDDRRKEAIIFWRQ